jgi:hypothetical protein
MSALPATTVAPERLTAADMRACIQAHFGTGGEKYAVLFEVRNGTAWAGDRSVDAVVMTLWPSLGLELWGMEIKCDRYDWIRELNNPGKASKVFDYFDRWFLVAPEGIAKREEIPEPWGWYVPENGGLRRAREAAKNADVKPVNRNFLAALMRRTAKTDDVFIQRRVEDALKHQRAQYEADAEKRALQKLTDLRRDAEQWVKLRDLLKKKPDDFVYADDVVEAVRLIVKSGVIGTFGGLRGLLKEVDRTRDNLAKIAAELGVPTSDKPKRRRS